MLFIRFERILSDLNPRYDLFQLGFNRLLSFSSYKPIMEVKSKYRYDTYFGYGFGKIAAKQLLIIFVAGVQRDENFLLGHSNQSYAILIIYLFGYNDGYNKTKYSTTNNNNKNGQLFKYYQTMYRFGWFFAITKF